MADRVREQVHEDALDLVRSDSDDPLPPPCRELDATRAQLPRPEKPDDATTSSPRGASRSSSVSAPASIRASSKRSSTSPERDVVSVLHPLRRYSAGSARSSSSASIIAPQRGERRAEVVARPRDELAARIEELLEASRPLVERRTSARGARRGPRSGARALRSPPARFVDAVRRCASGRSIRRPRTSAAPSATSAEMTETRRIFSKSCIGNMTRPEARTAASGTQSRDERQERELAANAHARNL